MEHVSPRSPVTPTSPVEIDFNASYQKDLKLFKKRSLKRFYRRQNQLIERLTEADTRLLEFQDEDNLIPLPAVAPKVPTGAQWAISISFVMNMVLLALKLLATLQSGSLTVLAAAMDSALDLFSGAILFITHRLMQRRDVHLYPVGKARYENVGIIIFASVMGSASLQVITESIRRLAQPTEVALDISPLTLGVLGAVIGTKTVLFLWCWSWAAASSSCEALAQDHRNDVLTNTFSTVMVILAQQTHQWWLDPVGALMFSLWIIFSWAKTGHYHLKLLVGKRADQALLFQLTYFAARFHPKILQIDTVRGYHAGEKVFVEVDIILPPDMSLKEAHDIGEALQHGIESFDEVERAFVHCDYEGEHSGEHKLL